MAKHEDIKTMKLYTHLDRIERRLRRHSPSQSVHYNGEVLDPEVLSAHDCLHYFGDEPLHKIQKLIEAAGGTQARVLDVGTGYGGSARLLAHRTGCHVDALELQPDLSAVAQELTTRCGLQDRVTHLTGDFLLRPIQEQQYDVVVALLCFMHVGNWRELFTRCLKSLKPGGVLYVEDFVRLTDTPFTQEETRILKEDIYTQDLITRSEMHKLLEDVGFQVHTLDDVTAKWTPYVSQRAVSYESELDKHIELDGEDAARALNHFYKSVARVFIMGNLGGYVLTARRPSKSTPKEPCLSSALTYLLPLHMHHMQVLVQELTHESLSIRWHQVTTSTLV